MKYYTWAEIRTKVEADCDLQDETFITTTELLSYVNEAIDEAEAEIHGLYEDYFLKSTTIPVVSQDQMFSIPTYMPDIYGDKIRKIMFSSGGTNVYPVNRLKDWKKFEQKAYADTQVSTTLYNFFLVNQTVGNPEIMLVPKATQSGTLTVWYLRNANRLTVDTDICDIPEFINFIFAHMKVKVFAKEGHPGYNEALERLEQERGRMLGVLSNRVPDAENEIELDLSMYGDMS
jgi:hypothetical protein